MTLIARAIIDAARGRHKTFDVTRHPNRVLLLHFLSPYTRELHGKVARIDPDALRTNVVTSLPLADHAAGIALGTTRMVEEVTGTDSTDTDFPIDLIPPTHRLDQGIRNASAWQIGDRLYLSSPASLWDNVATVTAAIVGVPTALATLDDEIALPDNAESVLIEKVAAFMAGRSDKEAGVNIDARMAAAAAAEDAYLNDVANRLTGQVIRTRDVYTP